MPMSPQRLGALWVALQFTALAVLAGLGGPVFWRGAAGWGAWGLLLCGLAVGGAAVAANRPGNFNIHPAPRSGGVLITRGIYQFIRHPMYSSVMLCGAAAAWAAGSGWAALVAGALCVVLWRKAVLEEAWMQRSHSGHAAYAARTRRFVPGLW